MRQRLGTNYRRDVTAPRRAGRPPDPALDEAILAAALDVLATDGPSRLTFSEVARRAGTTRPAVYRRFDDTDELAVAAIARLGRSTAPTPSGDGLADLVAELRAFQRGISTANGVALAGAVLALTTTSRVTETYRSTVVTPRRRRLRSILDRAASEGRITAGARDRSGLVTMCTGSWYAYALAGEAPPRDWATRTARLVWTAAGGSAR
jgi:AcrR family transcriptional regulator